jgi:hypothetical protein
MQTKLSSFAKWFLLVSLFMVTLPLTASAQRRLVVVQPRRQRVVVYQPAPRVIYRETNTTPYYNYGYAQPSSYSTRYYSYGYPTPYNGSGYSYTYTQPYYSNPYAYSQVTPTYSYSYREYRPRYRRSRARLGIYLR